MSEDMPTGMRGRTEQLVEANAGQNPNQTATVITGGTAPTGIRCDPWHAAVAYGVA